MLPPTTSDEDVARAIDQARRIAAPIKLATANRSWSITSKVLTGWMTFEGSGASLRPGDRHGSRDRDPQEHQEARRDQADERDVRPRSRRADLRGQRVIGRPRARRRGDGRLDRQHPRWPRGRGQGAIEGRRRHQGGRPGRHDERGDQEGAARGARSGPGRRTTRSVPTTGSPRTSRSRRASWTGWWCRPGETFDFWRALGEVSFRTGYRLGGAIVGGHSVEGKALAGGICAASTTLFNAAARGGLQIVTRQPHWYYITRYPLGLDATVSDSQTMRFRNDTAHPVMIRSQASPGIVHFEIWSVPNGRTTRWSTPIVTERRPRLRYDPVHVVAAARRAAADGVPGRRQGRLGHPDRARQQRPGRAPGHVHLALPPDGGDPADRPLTWTWAVRSGPTDRHEVHRSIEVVVGVVEIVDRELAERLE